jgi:hypothetical protein
MILTCILIKKPSCFLIFRRKKKKQIPNFDAMKFLSNFNICDSRFANKMMWKERTRKFHQVLQTLKPNSHKIRTLRFCYNTRCFSKWTFYHRAQQSRNKNRDSLSLSPRNGCTWSGNCWAETADRPRRCLRPPKAPRDKRKKDPHLMQKITTQPTVRHLTHIW